MRQVTGRNIVTTADRLEKELREAGADDMMIADALNALYEAEAAADLY
jgi:hypothetical protein